MNLTKQNKFILAIGLQLIVIVGIIIFKFSILSGGTDVLLKIMPVDPRDPFRGDYVTFQYDISNIPGNYFNYRPNNGDAVFIPLRKSGKYWITSYGAGKTKPTNNNIFLKAKVISGGTNGKSAPLAWGQNNGQIRVKYGIEEYFIPEGTGRNVSFFNKEAHAKVAIDDDGNSVLKQIFLEDRLWP